MDISALSLLFGAQVEQTGQTPVAPGFDLTLEQVEVGGFVPPGAPPGLDPPPDILVAGEGVEVLEPNAQPQRLDLLPQTKIDLDIELPTPFWEKPVDEELPVSPKPVDQAMEWLAGQMTGGFFANPIPTSGEFTFVKPSPTPDCILRLPGIQPMPIAKPAVLDLGKIALTPATPSANTEVITPPAASKQTISPEILESLNVEKVEVDAVEFVKLPDFKTAVDAKPIQTSPQIAEAVEQPTLETITPVEADTTPDPLFTKQPLTHQAEPVTPAVVEKSTPATAKPLTASEIAPVEIDSTTPVEEAPTESTALNAGKPEPKTEKTAPPTSQREFGHSHKKEKPLETAVVETVSKVHPGQGNELKHARPELAVDSNTILPGPVTSVSRSEALPPKEIDLVLRQVVDKLHMLAAARPKNGVTIHLNPEDLGSITLVVRSIGRMVDTQLSASDHRVRQALDQNQTRLVEAMDARGYQVQTVTVSAQTNNSTQQESTRGWNQSNQQQNQNQSGQSHSHRGHGDRHFDQPKANIRAWVRRGEGVDLSI